MVLDVEVPNNLIFSLNIVTIILQKDGILAEFLNVLVFELCRALGTGVTDLPVCHPLGHADTLTAKKHIIARKMRMIVV